MMMELIVSTLVRVIPTYKARNITFTNEKKKPNMRHCRNSQVASYIWSDEISIRTTAGIDHWHKPNTTAAVISRNMHPCIITGPTSRYCPSPFRRAIMICEPVLNPKAMVKTQMYSNPPMADAPNSTSPTCPRKAVSVTLITFCANKASKIG